MKILHVIDSAGIYGAEIMLLNLMEEHKIMSHVPILLSIEEPDAASGNAFSERATSRGLSVIKINVGRGFSKGSGRRIWNIAEEHEVDLVHSHGYKGNILLGSVPRSVRKVPLISTIHGWTATRVFTRIWYYKLLDRMFLRRTDAVVNVNSTGPCIGKVETFVVENGIPELNFDNETSGDDEISVFCRGEFIVGSIARLSEEKGLIYLINAISELHGRGVRLKAVIIGDGPQKKELENYIRRKNLAPSVMLAGYRDKAYKYLPMLNVFVLPSLTEGLPITILEALQAAVPTVASRVGGVSRVLGGGKFGVLTDPGDHRSIADAIEYLHSNPEQAAEMGRKAKEAVLANYSIDRMAREYIKVYEAVLAKWKQ